MNFTDRLNKLNPEELIKKVRTRREEEYQQYCKEHGIVPRVEKAVEPCKTCGSGRIATVIADGKDLSSLIIGDREEEGYLPVGIGIGPGGGEIDFSYCLECGQMQGEFPIFEANADKAIQTMDPDYEEEDEN